MNELFHQKQRGGEDDPNRETFARNRGVAAVALVVVRFRLQRCSQNLTHRHTPQQQKAQQEQLRYYRRQKRGSHQHRWAWTPHQWRRKWGCAGRYQVGVMWGYRVTFFGMRGCYDASHSHTNCKENTTSESHRSYCFAD